ncbi:MAG TPA: LLM class flavin-dependent oxidoreductase [Polyangia bacterium]|nr:LLM class flavin-dependent oxidoreductase [Polyangia bacterium]
MSTQRPRRELILNTFFMRFGHHPSAWRHPSAVGDGRPDVDYWLKLATLSERAKLHTFFLADFIGRAAQDLEAHSHMGVAFQFEPISLLSYIAAHTKHIGLVATVNTNFEHPYKAARAFASLDHISGGRAGWNVVSSAMEGAVGNFGLERPPTHAERYERAAEFVSLAKKLWDSWDDDAFDRPDRARGRFYEPAAAHPVHHKGKHFASDGVLDIARPIQGYPVLVQAGNSDTGREFAAEIAEMIYASAQSLEVAQVYYRDVKGRMARYGREPDQLKITPGLSVVVGRTDQEARDKFEGLQSLVDFTRGLLLFGVDVSKLDLDGPLPDNLPEPENGKGRMKQLVELARRENLTVRQLVLRFGVARGHLQVIGSPAHVADVIEAWFTQEGADGFNVVPPLLPGGFEDFVELVVPELQRRGLFHRDYSGATYRENLGLVRPGDLRRRPSAPTRPASAPIAAELG